MMKMNFETPEMKIERFVCENIVMTSGVTAAENIKAQFGSKMAEVGLSDQELKIIITI